MILLFLLRPLAYSMKMATSVLVSSCYSSLTLADGTCLGNEMSTALSICLKSLSRTSKTALTRAEVLPSLQGIPEVLPSLQATEQVCSSILRDEARGFCHLARESLS